MDKKAKHCPFCGSKNVDWVPATFGDGYQYECGHCGAQTKSFETKEEARAAWNSRYKGPNTIKIDPKKLAAARDAKGITGKQLAELSGVHFMTIYNYEHYPDRYGYARRSAVEPICKALGISLKDIEEE